MADFEVIPIQPIPDDIVDQMCAEAFEAGTVIAYIGNLSQRFSEKKLLRFMSFIAHSVEPSESPLAADDTSYAMTFYRASLLGLRAIANSVNDIDAVATALPDGVTKEDTKSERSPESTARQLMELGLIGYGMFEDSFGTVLQEWGPKINPDITRQPYIHSGFGFPLLLMAALIHKNEQAETTQYERDFMALQVDEEVRDWDKLAQQLFES